MIGKAGRPRSPATDRAILDAALALLLERGVDGASIERIAKRAGVAKTSIYRRWPSREHLLAQAVEAGGDGLGAGFERLDRAAPDEIAALLVEDAARLGQPETRRMLARLIGSLPDRPRLTEAYRETAYLPRRRALIRALRRAQRDGLLPPDADVGLLADMLTGAVIYRALVGVDTGQQLRSFALRLLRQAGFGAAPAGRPAAAAEKRTPA